MNSRLPVLLLLLAGVVHAEAQLETEVVPSARAAELQAVLAPLAAPEGSVSAYLDQLLIRATPDKLAEIHKVLKELDRPLKNLRISVRYRQEGSESRQDVGLQGRVDVRDGRPESRVVVQAQSGAMHKREDHSSSITALEGTTVMIATGSSVPVLTATNSSGRLVSQQYVPVQNGIQVTPRPQPDGEIRLEIRFQQAQISSDGTIAGNSTETQIRARPGQWTPLASIDRRLQQADSGRAGRYRQASTTMPLEILVEMLPE
jgi:hypothetical protein